MNITHGLSKHPLYGVLKDMHNRCEYESHSEYYLYGARGITVCDEWTLSNIQTFVTWALEHGWQQGLEIDRIDNNKGYSPDNCRFVTRQNNCRNRSNNKHVVINGEEMLLCEAIERFCVVDKKEFERRYYHRKWPLEKALFQEKQIRKKKINKNNEPTVERTDN